MANGDGQSTQRMLDAAFEKAAYDQLEAWQDELKETTRERDVLNSELIKLRTKINGLRASLSMEAIDEYDAQARADLPQEPDEPSGEDPRRERVLAIAERILEARRRQDMHYSELATAVMDRGGQLPTNEKSRHDTLIRMLNDDPQNRFLRPNRRGYYALRQDYPDAESVGSRRSQLPDAT